MARRSRNPLSGQAFQRVLTNLTRTGLRIGTKMVSKAVTEALRVPKPAKRTPVKRALTQALPAKPLSTKPLPSKRLPVAKPKSVNRTPAAAGHWTAGIAIGTAGARRYHLFKPPGVQGSERLPLLVMLHGCGQDAEAFAASTRMNRVATRARFFVLYPEQDRFSNGQGCWNWFDTRTGRAQSEADTIEAAIQQVCLTQAVDPGRIGLAGLSAGAGLAALMATRHPARFRGVAMHSGIAPGVASSSATALRAMMGRRTDALPMVPGIAGAPLPPLLVIQGTADAFVASGNGAVAARLWAAEAGARASAPRTVQRGERYPATITDYRAKGKLVSTLCEIRGLAHAWSGGAAGVAFSDPHGPDASRMIWTFIAKQFLARKR